MGFCSGCLKKSESIVVQSTWLFCRGPYLTEGERRNRVYIPEGFIDQLQESYNRMIRRGPPQLSREEILNKQKDKKLLQNACLRKHDLNMGRDTFKDIPQ